LGGLEKGRASLITGGHHVLPARREKGVQGKGEGNKGPGKYTYS